MKNYMFLLLTAYVLVSSCNLFTNYGKKVEFGESEVFYKGDGVTEGDAKNVGRYLKEAGYFDGGAKSVQLTKDEDDYLVHFVVNEKKITDAARLNWWKMQYDISKEVFDGKPVRVALADENLKDIEILNPVACYSVGKSSLYYDNSEIKKADAKKLVAFLTEVKLMGEDKEADSFYQMEDGSPIVRIVVNPDKITSQVLPVFSYWQEQMKEKVFNGEKTKMMLISTKYEALKPLPKLTAEQRQAFQYEQNQPNDQVTENRMDSVTTETTTSGILRLPNN